MANDHRTPHFARAFTLMELMVSIAILVIIILAVGQVFGGASRAVSVSQATMEMNGNVRAVQSVMEHDFGGLDHGGFLVIRSRLQDVSNPQFSRRFDQVAFIANGAFPNRTGANDVNAPFAENSVANSAHIWIGQMVVEKGAPPVNSSYLASDQTFRVPIDALPTGITSGPSPIINENQFVLGIHRFLLYPGPPDANFTIRPSGNPITAYPTIDYVNSKAFSVTGAGETTVADITSSRFDAVGMTTSQLMHEIAADRFGGDLLPEVDRFCYRFKTLASVYDTDVLQNPFVNGCFRLHPVALQGVSSFAVEWTDGSYYTVIGPNQEPVGSLKWYGPNLVNGNAGTGGAGTPFPNDVAEQFNPAPTGIPGIGDQYIVTFNYLNRAKWPKAIRLSYHISEPNNRLQGGRDFVQVINLPN